MIDLALHILAAIGFVTVLTGIYRVRWIFNPKSWKAGASFLGEPHAW